MSNYSITYKYMLLVYPSFKRKLYINIFFELINEMNRAKSTSACTVHTENNSITEVLKPPLFFLKTKMIKT